jgi:hypothetical protein
LFKLHTDAGGFAVLPKRWVEERTHAWTERAREALINCQVPGSSRRVSVFWQQRPISGAFSGGIASFSGVFRGLPELRADRPLGQAISGLRSA